MKLLIAATHVVLLLSYVVSTVSAQERKPVLEQFEEYMEGGPGPTSSTDQAQVNPPKVWRRKREVKENYNSVEKLLMDTEAAKNFARRIDNAA